MPIKIANGLPAAKTLERENIFCMTDEMAMTQDIRPLRVLLLNLMPTKIETETQLARVLGNTPIQIELELIAPSSHNSRHVSPEHMLSFYRTFDEIKEENFDGLVITGAPIEHLEFEDVDYWPELCRIMEWSKTHVHSTLHLCWGAQAALYYHYGIPKRWLDEKLFGVFPHRVERQNYILFRGVDDEFYIPHSRHTTVRREDIEAVPELTIMASSPEAGVYAVKTEEGRQIFLMGHAEYDRDTLKNEYLRDRKAGKPISVPKNYFPDDDPSKTPVVRWRASGNLIYANWVNYFLYQTAPYDIRQIGRIRDNHANIYSAPQNENSIAGENPIIYIRPTGGKYHEAKHEVHSSRL
jgi:homoserine O-succinyltransferase